MSLWFFLHCFIKIKQDHTITDNHLYSDIYIYCLIAYLIPANDLIFSNVVIYHKSSR